MSVFCPVEKSFWLQKVCESNYRKLLDLLPDLSRAGAVATARTMGRPPLYLRLLERSRYTLLLELSHDFAPEHGRSREPALKIRICLDSKTAEALSDHCRPFVLDALKKEQARAVLDYKWSLNYFLARWLDHCLAKNYRFGAWQSEAEPCLATA
ncbi:DUF1249 domain-containing protein [Candidatus Methylocalor cossyra]|uniref:DUF1249 domain-containing protein n=1 Tax=Candidatus Methylocalor cossyra TaxID=3108543 RepID=A0ABP1C725_9GAMM